MDPDTRTVIASEEMVAAMARDYRRWMLRRPLVLGLLGGVSLAGAGLLILGLGTTAALWGMLLLVPVLTYVCLGIGARRWFTRWFPPGTPVSFAVRPDGFVLSSAYSTTFRPFARLGSIDVDGRSTMLTLRDSRQEIVVAPTEIVPEQDLRIQWARARAVGR